MKLRTFLEAVKAACGDDFRHLHLYTETYYSDALSEPRVEWRLSLYVRSRHYEYAGSTLEDLLRQVSGRVDQTVAVDEVFGL